MHPGGTAVSTGMELRATRKTVSLKFVTVWAS